MSNATKNIAVRAYGTRASDVFSIEVSQYCSLVGRGSTHYAGRLIRLVGKSSVGDALCQVDWFQPACWMAGVMNFSQMAASDSVFLSKSLPAIILAAYPWPDAC